MEDHLFSFRFIFYSLLVYFVFLVLFFVFLVLLYILIDLHFSAPNGRGFWGGCSAAAFILVSGDCGGDIRLR